MHIVFGFFGVIASLLLLKYRAPIGDTMGDPEWMKYVGGVYNFVIILSIIIFFWSVATMTNTTDIFFRPILYLIPGAHPTQQMPGGAVQ